MMILVLGREAGDKGGNCLSAFSYRRIISPGRAFLCCLLHHWDTDKSAKRAKRARRCAEKMTVDESCQQRWDREMKTDWKTTSHLSPPSPPPPLHERLDKNRRAVTQLAAVYVLRRHVNLKVWQPGCISTDTYKCIYAHRHTPLQIHAHN